MGCAVADEPVGRAEFHARFDGLKDRLDGMDKRMDDFVTVDAWTRENKHVSKKQDELDRDCRERTAAVERSTNERFRKNEKGREITWGRALALLTIAATILAAAIGAYITTKGIK